MGILRLVLALWLTLLTVQILIWRTEESGKEYLFFTFFKIYWEKLIIDGLSQGFIFSKHTMKDWGFARYGEL